MSQKIIELPALFSLQKEIEDDPARFKVLDIGRRWGKTFFLMRQSFKICVRRYLKYKRKQRGWIVAPTFPLVREDWLSAEIILKDAIVNKHQTEMRMDFGGLGFIEFKSAEREDEGLRGAGLDFALCDECSRISQKSIDQGIFPALADKQGEAIFVSTPKGRNYFYQLFLMGKNEPGWKSWQYPSFTNPYFPKEEWERIKKVTPEMILRQEYMADFLENEATVFKNIDKCYRGEFEAGNDKEYYTVGVDLGRTEDFTVVAVIRNRDAQLVHLYRQNKVDWSLQKKQILALSKLFRHSIFYIDSTGLGDPIEEDLRKSGVNTKDYKFTNSSKQELVEQLIVAIEQGLIGIPQIEQTAFLIDELKAFGYEVLPSGKIRYSAPAGLHDDGVMALGLAVYGIQGLLGNKAREVRHDNYKGTAQYWDDYYARIDRQLKSNPFLTRGEALNRLRNKKWQKLLRV